MTKSDFTNRLINYASDFTFDHIPKEVVYHSKIILLDTLGAMLAASNPNYPASRIITEFVREQGCKEESTIIGRDFKTSAPYAALANGTMGYMCDIESHHVKAVLHEAAVLLPSALAVGDKVKASGKDIITAFVLGVDLNTRISLALSPTGMYARGFHPTVVAGCFGSAITSGKLLKLKPKEFSNAFGLAGTQASTLLSWESDQTEMSRPFGPGIAARNGVTAALLAQRGFGGPEVLEGKYTIFNAFSGEEHSSELFDELGKRFEVMNLAIKQYSSCSFTHPGLDALLHIMNENKLHASEIKKIKVRFAERGAKLIDNSDLKSHNIQYILAVGAYNKHVIIDDILFEQKDKRIWDLSKRVDLIYDKELDEFFPTIMSTIVEVETKDGKTFTNKVDYAKGTIENPLKYDEIKNKFRRITNNIIDEELKKEIVKRVMELEKINYVNNMTEILSF
jgi:2-methylcitrate dehydratase PrpD